MMEINKPPLKRKRCRLSRKEETEMRKRHKDMSLLLKIIAREVTEMEVVDEEKEERLE